jgi:hypothetical protein
MTTARTARVAPRTLHVVGSDLRSAVVTAFAWPGALLLGTTGTDAGALLLLGDLAPGSRVGRVSMGLAA